MVNTNKLKGKIIEEGFNTEQFAKEIKMSRSAFYRKISGNGEKFLIKEAELISKVLNLTIEEINAIFFAQNVA